MLSLRIFLAVAQSPFQLGPLRNTHCASVYVIVASGCQIPKVDTVFADVYYIAFPLDHARLKTIVSVIYILEILQVITATHDGFRMFASGWSDLVELDNIGLLWFTVPVMNGVSEWLHFAVS